MNKWMSKEHNQKLLSIDGIANGKAFFSYSENEQMVLGIAVPIKESTILLNTQTVKQLIEDHNGIFVIE